MIPTEGTVAAGYEAIAEAFIRNFEPTTDPADAGDLGAGVTVMHGGRAVVDLVGGWADVARTRRWKPDTLVNIYSVGKPVAAVVALQAVADGLIGLDDRLADLWPGWDSPGSSATTLRMALSHQAGLPGLRQELAGDAWASWATMTSALATCEPWWDPGTAHGYHVNTFGFLVGHPAVVARGSSFTNLVRDRIARPLGAALYASVPSRELARCADVAVDSPPGLSGAGWPAVSDHEKMLKATYFNPPSLSGQGVVNTRAWRQAVVPSTNMHGTAAGVAAFYNALLNPSEGGLELPASLVAEATASHSDGTDAVLGRPSRFGLGFQLDQPSRSIGLTASSFGHYGYGGSLGFADPDGELAVAYVVNRPGDRWQNPRVRRLRDAVASCI